MSDKLLTNDEVDKLIEELKLVDFFDEDTEPFGIKITVCECGSEKVGSPRHSTWCPKFN